MNLAMALPPPPPDRFSKETLVTMPDLRIASQNPRAVPSHPPPGPAGIKKWVLAIYSSAAIEVLKDKTSIVLSNRIDLSEETNIIMYADGFYCAL